MKDFPGSPVVKTSPSNAGGAGSLPGRGAKIPLVSRLKHQNIIQKQYCNKFNKDFKKNGLHQKKSLKQNKTKHLTVEMVLFSWIKSGFKRQLPLRERIAADQSF